MITLSFILIALVSVSVAYFLRDRFSGVGLKRRYAVLCICYNFIFGFSYLKLSDSGCITYFGCFSDLEKDYPVIAWGAFFCSILHAFAHPVEWVPRIRLRRKLK